MKRRVIKQGNNTLTITLPRKWAEKYGIKAGEELEVEEREQNLIINSKETVSGGDISINLSNENESPRRLVFSAFCKGYDEIKITFEDEKAIDVINSCAEMMIGFEIVQQGKNYCVLKNIAQGIDDEFKTIFNRLILTAITMGKDIYQALNENKTEKISNIAKMESLANKFCLFCRRMINIKHKRGENNESLDRLACLYEEITDYYKEICTILSSRDIKMKKESIALLQKINEMIALNYKLFQNRDENIVSQIKKREFSLRKDAATLIKKTTKEETLIICNISKIIEANHNISEEIF